MTCPGGIDDGEKQRLSSLNSPGPHDTKCSICRHVFAAYLIGSEWVLKQHDAPLLPPPKGKGIKQPAGKLCIKSRDIESRFRTRKERAKRNGRKAARRKR